MTETTQPELTTFETSEIDVVSFRADDVPSLNPVTEQTDLYLIEFTYEPNGRCVDSEALKLYLGKFASLKLHAETITATIADDLFEAIKPHQLSVRTTHGTDGFLKTSVASRR
jgi:NADPH-dependent 7-cyano-7-deazaguanine reductase QueF